MIPAHVQYSQPYLQRCSSNVASGYQYCSNLLLSHKMSGYNKWNGNLSSRAVLNILFGPNGVFIFSRIMQQKVDRIRITGVQLKQRQCAMKWLRLLVLGAAASAASNEHHECTCSWGLHAYSIHRLLLLLLLLHTFNGPLSETTQVSWYQKDKTNLDFTEATDSEWQWHQLGHMQVCTLLQTDNHTSIPPLSFLQTGCPSWRPTNSVKALKACYMHYAADHLTRTVVINEAVAIPTEA